MAGGDGTVGAAAAVARETAVRDGEAVQVDLGLAGARPFVNTSSTGVYVDLVNASRQLEAVLGKRLAEVVVHGKHPHALVVYRKADG